MTKRAKTIPVFTIILLLATALHGQPYPSYNTSPTAPDSSGMTSVATEIAGHIQAGWNIGNTLEAIGSETAWGNPMITNELIQLVKQNGFQAIRLPASWDQYANQETAKINFAWLNRIKQVVQYCVENDMYVILNIHWDGGWLENNVVPEKQTENNAKQKAYWEQIATHLRDFDEHLIFASANEPNVDNATQMAVLLSYHQTFVDTVRSTGGRNAYRVLAIQGPATDIEKTDKLMDSLPIDTVPSRLMAEVHFYTPYNFTLMTEDQSWGNQFYYWGADFHSETDPTRNPTWGEEDTLDELFDLMKTKYVDQGIPVIVGEFAAMRRTTLEGENLALHLASRAHFLDYITERSNALGFLPFYWDAGGLGNHGSGIFDRDKNTIFDQQALDALTQIETEQYWKEHGPSYANAANPDQDWANNLMEHFLGSDPRDRTSIPERPTLRVDADNRLVYTINRFSRSNAQLIFEYSVNLSTWNEISMSVTEDSEIILKYVSDNSLTEMDEIFIRLKVTF